MSTVKIPEQIKDASIYEVQLARPIKIGRVWMRPGPGVRLKGTVIKEHADDVVSAKSIAS